MRGGSIATFVSMLHIIVVSAGWLAKNRHYAHWSAVTHDLSALWRHGWNCRLTLCLLHDFPVSRQRNQREIFAIEVVHQIEHARETGAGEKRLIPRAVTLLRTQQVCDATRHRVAARVV